MLLANTPGGIQGVLGLWRFKGRGGGSRNWERGREREARISGFLFVFMLILVCVIVESSTMGVRNINGTSLVMDKIEKWREDFILGGMVLTEKGLG